jgi:hypothetical protein
VELAGYTITLVVGDSTVPLLINTTSDSSLLIDIVWPGDGSRNKNAQFVLQGQQVLMVGCLFDSDGFEMSSLLK